MKMRDIMPEHVREWVTWMKDKGASAQTIQYTKGSVLNAIFTTALVDDVVTIHPSHGVKTPPAPAKPRRIITPAQFDRLYQALPDATPGCWSKLAIESGMRWGELTEIRARRPGLRDWHPHRQPRRRGTHPRRPSRRRALPGQGVPQRQGVPAVQAQRADRSQDTGLRRRTRPG